MDFEIGKIVNTHGLKGEIKILPTTDDPRRFDLLKTLDIFKNGEITGYEIENIRYQKNLVFAKLKNINTIEEAAELKNSTIKISKEMALPLENNQYYIKDLYGLKVLSSGEYLGTIKEVIQTGANDVYVIEREKEKDLLIPAIKQCVLDVDLKERVMTVSLLKGL